MRERNLASLLASGLTVVTLLAACGEDGSSQETRRESSQPASTPTQSNAPATTSVAANGLDSVPSDQELKRDCAPPASHSLDVTAESQLASNWCWAASGEMTMDFLGAHVKQCDEADQQFGLSTCCNATRGPGCDKSGWPEYNKYGFNAQQVEAALPWEKIKEEIFCEGRPVAFSWKWLGDGGHMMVAIGYSSDDARRYVEIINPLEAMQGAYPVTYEDYDAGVDHTHWRDYFGITKIPPEAHEMTTQQPPEEIHQ